MRFATAAALVLKRMEVRDEKRLVRFRKQVLLPDLVFIDDLGFLLLSWTVAEMLFEGFSQRYQRGLALVTSKLPFAESTEVLRQRAADGAFLGRLKHQAQFLEMDGDNCRLKTSKQKLAADAASPGRQTLTPPRTDPILQPHLGEPLAKPRLRPAPRIANTTPQGSRDSGAGATCSSKISGLASNSIPFATPTPRRARSSAYSPGRDNRYATRRLASQMASDSVTAA